MNFHTKDVVLVSLSPHMPLCQPAHYAKFTVLREAKEYFFFGRIFCLVFGTSICVRNVAVYS